MPFNEVVMHTMHFQSIGFRLILCHDEISFTEICYLNLQLISMCFAVLIKQLLISGELIFYTLGINIVIFVGHIGTHVTLSKNLNIL